MFLFGTRLATSSATTPPPRLSRPVPNANARRRQLTPYDLIKSQVRASSSWRDPTLQYKSSFVLSTAGTILVAIVGAALPCIPIIAGWARSRLVFMQPYYLRLWRMSSQQKVVFAVPSSSSPLLVSPRLRLRLHLPRLHLPHRHPHRRHRRRVILNCVKTLAPCMSHSSLPLFSLNLPHNLSLPHPLAHPSFTSFSIRDDPMTRALPCNVSLWGLRCSLRCISYPSLFLATFFRHAVLRLISGKLKHMFASPLLPFTLVALFSHCELNTIN